MSSKESQFRDRIFDLGHKAGKSRQTSVERLGDLKYKLESSFRPPKNNGDLSWKAFRTEIRTQSTRNFIVPSLSHYQDISSFRSTTPKQRSVLVSPGRARHYSGHSKQFLHSRTSSPLMLSPSSIRDNFNFTMDKKRIQEIICLEDLHRAIEVIEEMSETDCNQLTIGYKQALLKFCSRTMSKVRPMDF
ncbi:unnamed protein product [Blepharisma stoltei]|uniref:Uncharacterized protein n=1 Tax=Blepharisma stoltei TaxID=1481888 RepID=A0AAU9JG13_9CILI|nr:unnamed protein product [Blepharisma stoltei]